MKHDCMAVLAKLYEYVDNELGETEREGVVAHLEACRPCLTRFEFEQLFQEYVTRRAPRPAARAEFKQNLLARIAEERASGGGAPIVNIGWRRFAMAALIVLGVGVISVWMSGRYGPRQADWPLLAAYHHEMVETDPGEVDVLETQDFAEARAFVISRFGSGVDRILPTAMPSSMATNSAAIQPWAKTELAHLAFASSDGEVSMFMVPASAFALTDEAITEVGGQSYRTVTLGCCRAVCWEKDGDYVCTLIGDCEISRLLAVAQELHEGNASPGRPGAHDNTTDSKSLTGF